MINTLQRKVRQVLLQNLLNLKHFKVEDSILIFSEARGGSTWLMEMLAHLPETCINWEPLHDDSGVVPKKYNFGWIPYIPTDDRNEAYLELMHQILTYKISSPYTRKYLTIINLLRADTVITKFVRANLLFPFLMTNFTLKYPSIFLLRHPIDTCLSQLEAFKKNDKSFITEKIPDQINNERYKENIDYIISLETKLEQKIANWCLNNVSTIDQLSLFDNVIIVYYSDLLLDPKKEMARIIDQLGFRVDKNSFLEQINFRKVSTTDFKKQFKNDPQEQLHKNFEKLDKKTKDKVQKVFDHFKFKLY